jgi:putative membrane protein
MAFVDDPVNGALRQLGPSSNYGKGLSPYFLALSLWVGALVVTVIVPGGMRKGFGLRQGTSLAVSFAQSLILSGGILLLLPLTPVHPWAFWGIMAGITVAWWAVMRLLAEKLGDGGRLLGIVLLVVQLAGSAGTYPIQLSPKIFADIHPYLPMTWAIHLLRYAISGAMAARAGSNLLWLGLVAVIAWVLVQFIPGRIPFNSPPLEPGLDESGPMESEQNEPPSHPAPAPFL